MNEKEARTWVTLEKCLKAGSLYRTVKNPDGGLVDTPPSEDKVKTLRAILNDINERALSKDRYDVMDIFYSLFFSDEAGAIIAMIDRYEHFDRKARKGKRGIKKRNARGALTIIRKLNSYIDDDGLADAQAYIAGVINGYFKQNPKHEKIDRTIEAFFKKNVNCSKDWIDKTRLYECAEILKDIGYHKYLKAILDLLKLVPPYKVMTRQALEKRIERCEPE